MKQTFADVVREYSAWKLQEKGNGRLSRKELASLREQFMKSKKQRIRESGSRNNSWDIYVSNYKKFKESQDPNSKITYKELKMLKENWKEASAKKVRLREADAGFDPTMAGAAAPMPGDPNAMAGAAPGMDPNAMAAAGAPATPVDPTIAAQIQDLVQSANALAASAGVGGAELGADPAAGMPPVDGMQAPGMAADPNAAAAGVPGAPMMESAVKEYKQWKLKNKGTAKLTESEVRMIAEEVVRTMPQKSRYEQIKERIAARNAQLKGLNEGYLDIPTTAEMGTLTSKPHHSNSQGGDHSVTEEQVKVPTAGQLANGYTSGKAAGETKAAKTWPTKAMGKEAGGALQGAGATQVKAVKEAEETEEGQEEDKLQEGIKTVTQIYTDRFFEPRLDFQQIKEAMKEGMLG